MRNQLNLNGIYWMGKELNAVATTIYTTTAAATDLNSWYCYCCLNLIVFCCFSHFSLPIVFVICLQRSAICFPHSFIDFVLYLYCFIYWYIESIAICLSIFRFVSIHCLALRFILFYFVVLSFFNTLNFAFTSSVRNELLFIYMCDVCSCYYIKLIDK